MRRALAALAILLATGPASAEPADPIGVYYVEGHELRHRQLGHDATRTLATLPFDAGRVRRLAVGPTLTMFDLGGPVAVHDRGDAGALVLLPCRGPAWLGKDDGRVACAVGGGVAIFTIAPAAAPRVLAGEGALRGFGDRPGTVIVEQRGRLLRRGDGADADLGPAPVADLSVSPSGERAVGRATPDGGLDSFRLDGEGTRRSLMSGTPVAWSADGAWILVDSTDAACVVRAIGGEYKCFDGFRGRAIGADGQHVLLEKLAGAELFQAPLRGARSATPVALPGVPAGPVALR